MAFELLTEVPRLLREKHIVHFSDKWPDKWAGKYFRVEVCQQFEYHVHRIVPPGTSAPAQQDISFGKPPGGSVSLTEISLLPENDKTLYEILLGIKGLVLVLPRYDEEYFLRLQTPGAQPTLTDIDLRFLGHYSHAQSPYYTPKLREHTVTAQTPPVLRLFNPLINDEMIDLVFTVNKCKVREEPVTAVTEEEKRVAREIRHFGTYTW